MATPVATPYDAVRADVLARPPGEIVTVPKEALAPRPASWRRSIGYPQGRSLKQWRDGVVHVHETPTHYLLHRDQVDPHRDPIGHLLVDTPALARRIAAALVVAAAAVVAVVLR